MTLEYNNKTYDVTDESVYNDFMIPVTNLGEAVEVVTELDGIREYTFNLTAYTSLTARKRMIIIDDRGINVKVSLIEERR